MLSYFGAAFLGWSLGANDSANTFGTAVSARMVSARLAVCLIAAFVVIGATLQGAEGIETLSGLSQQTIESAILSSFAAAVAVTLMTLLSLPVSTSQAVVGAILGVSVISGNDVRWGQLGKILACWIGTPLGAMLWSIVLWHALKWIVRLWNPSMFTYDPVMRCALIVCGCYSAYALGANNAANVAGIFVETTLTVQQAALMGGVFIACGALTFGHQVMHTVGKGIVRLDAFAALISVLSLALTVHSYAMLGVPVSTSQGIVGAVIGIGLINGLQTINYSMLRKVCAGWLATPFIAAAMGVLLHLIVHLRYQP